VGSGDYDAINNASLFDPKTKQFERIASSPARQYAETNDLLGAGHLQLDDGNIFFISGRGRYYPGGRFTGSRQANIYNWKTGKWWPAGQLKRGRWYPTLVSLADGKVVIFSELKVNALNQVNPSIEIYALKLESFSTSTLQKSMTVPSTPISKGLRVSIPLTSILEFFQLLTVDF
jgi:hypothetical protein